MKSLPTTFAARVEEDLTKVTNLLTEKGRKEAQEGREARPIDAFVKLAAKVFGLDPTVQPDRETVQAVTDLWRDYYMDGYNAVKEVRSA